MRRKPAGPYEFFRAGPLRRLPPARWSTCSRRAAAAAIPLPRRTREALPRRLSDGFRAAGNLVLVLNSTSNFWRQRGARAGAYRASPMRRLRIAAGDFGCLVRRSETGRDPFQSPREDGRYVVDRRIRALSCSRWGITSEVLACRTRLALRAYPACWHARAALPMGASPSLTLLR
jgi:hypothetical protein